MEQDNIEQKRDFFKNPVLFNRTRWEWPKNQSRSCWVLRVMKGSQVTIKISLRRIWEWSEQLKTTFL